MSDSQSRYGIMNELNESKIQKKENLAKLEADVDQVVFTNETNISGLQKALADRAANYKHDHQTWKREKEMSLKLMQSANKRQEAELAVEISDRENSYEKEFLAFKDSQERAIASTKSELTRYQKDQAKRIAVAKEIIAEIDKSITDLKDMSEKQN